MHSSTLQGILEHLRKLTDPARHRDLSDGDLWKRFRVGGEEAAFTLLLQRHGAMVLNTCRRILGDGPETEDAFQATFLVLIRKGGTLRKGASLSSWLHVVATNVALKARARSARRRACECEATPPAQGDNSFDVLVNEELRAVLDEEIARLPDKYRTPLVLCYLAEKTHEQAAQELGWPKSSVTSRLARARQLLRQRLIRRGFTLPAGLLAALLTEQTANAAVPSLLTLSTVRLGVQALSGETLAATAAAALAGNFVQGTAALKLGTTLAALALLGFAIVGYHLAVHGPLFPPEQPPPKAPALGELPAAKSEPRKPRVDLFGDPLPDEVVARMGSGRLRHDDIRSLVFSPGGKQLVSSADNGLRIWDTETGKLLRRFDLDKGSRNASCRFVGDSIVAAVLDDKWMVTVQVVDAATGQIRRRVRIQEQANVYNTTLSPDGKRIAVTMQNEMRLYDTSTGEMVQRIPVKGVAAWDIAFSPDGKTVAHNDLSTDTIYFHDAASGKLIRELKRPGDTTLHLVFSPDGRLLASMPKSRITEKGEVSIWNLNDGKELHRWTHPFAKAWSAAFSPDGKRVAICGARWGLVLWDVETGKEVRRLNPHGGVVAIAFSPDGKTMATAANRGAIRLWDAATGNILPASADADVQSVDRLRFSSDGKRLFGAAGACLIWEATTGRELRRLADPSPLGLNHPNDMRFLALSNDESLLAAANSDGILAVWDAATGKEKRILKGHDRYVWNLVFTPDSRKLLCSCGDGFVRVWDMENGHQLHQLQGQSLPAVSADNRLLATGDAKTPTIFVYDLTTGRESKRFALGTEGNVYRLAFSTDNQFLAAAGSPRRNGGVSVVKIWDMLNGQLVRTLNDAKTSLFTVAFSPDGRSVATGDTQFGALLLWELASGRPRHSFVGHESQIISLAFSADGRSLAASSPDAPVYVWDVAGNLEARSRRLSESELRRCWADLANEDATKAFQSIRRLAAAPEQTLPLLRQHLKPVPAPDQKRVRQLVDMLDSDDFSTRQKAAEDLEQHADAAAALLRQIATKEKPSLETRRRLQQILEVMESKPETLRVVRAVEVLEWIGTPEAVRLIGELANGAANARLTREDAAAKRRLQR
ncbi:MAG: sigma-70 family RNA polymerase sigma factor [Gemmataceae bacterium]